MVRRTAFVRFIINELTPARLVLSRDVNPS
jgi:hypothetical protein